MRRIRPFFLVLAVLVVGLFAGTMLQKLVLQPRTTEEAPGEEHTGREGPAEYFGANGYDTWGLDEFGGGGFGGGPTESLPPPLEVWVEAKFIEIDTTEFEEITIGDTPADEKLLLTPEEKRDLLRRLKSKPSFRTAGSASVTTVSGQQALMQIIESVPYFTERESPDKVEEDPDKDNGVEEESDTVFQITCWPALELEEIELGVRLNVTPTISSDRTIITLILLPEVSFITGWADLGGGVAQQPFVRSHNVTTTVYTRDGLTFMMTGNPVGDFGGATPPHLKPQVQPVEEKTIIVLITARLIEIPLDEEEVPEKQPAEDADLILL